MELSSEREPKRESASFSRLENLPRLSPLPDSRAGCQNKGVPQAMVERIARASNKTGALPSFYIKSGFMPTFGSSKSEYSPPTLGQIPQMRYNVTQPLAKQQNGQFSQVEVDSFQPARTTQFYEPGRIDASFVFGTVEGNPAQPGATPHPSNPNGTELRWQHQVQVGDEIVFHHLKDDGKGRLSFFRATVNLKNDSSPLSKNIADVSAEAWSQASGISRKVPPSVRDVRTCKAAEPISVAHSRVSVEACSPSPEAAVVSAVDAPAEPSVRAAVGVGLAVNLLALAVGGYLLQVAPSGSEQNTIAAVQEQNQVGLGAIAKASSDNIAAPEYSATPQGQAEAAIEASDRQLLQQAYDRAIARDFTGAVDSLKQIPASSAAGEIARSKISEYEDKQRLMREVEAHQLLQEAYNRAVIKDFAGAVSFIKQVPKDTVAYAKVQAKLVEYGEKQRQLSESRSASAPAPRALPTDARSQPSQPADTVLEISSHPRIPSLVPATDAPRSFRSLNPGEMLLEIDPQSAIISFPETNIGS